MIGTLRFSSKSSISTILSHLNDCFFAEPIQEIVNQPDWSGEAIVLMFGDNPANPSAGTREAESFNGSASDAPLLHISFE